MFGRSSSTRQDGEPGEDRSYDETADSAENGDRYEHDRYDRDGSEDRFGPRERYRDDPSLAQEERFGGLNLGAAFFGWLVAVAVSILLTGIIGAVAAVVGYSAQVTQGQAKAQAGTIGLVGGIVLLVVLLLGYYSGGYVAGRMSRFSGSRQGFGVWLIGLVVTIVAVVLGAVFGQQYDVLRRVNLPRLPVSVGSLSTAGVVAAVVLLIGTLVAALAGGSVGTHYHRRVDRAGRL